MKETLLGVLKRLDTSGNGGGVSKEELVALMRKKHARNVVASLEVDVQYFLELVEMVFDGDGPGLTVPGVMELILACRGDRPATVRDMVDRSAFIIWKVTRRLQMQEWRMASWMEEVVMGRAVCQGAASSRAPYPLPPPDLHDDELGAEPGGSREGGTLEPNGSQDLATALRSGQSRSKVPD